MSACSGLGLADGLVHRSRSLGQRRRPTSLGKLSRQFASLSSDRPIPARIILSIICWRMLRGTVHGAVCGGPNAQATVTRIMPYGAFARVADGVEGLVHVSELADRHITDPSEVVRVGEVLPVRIVSVGLARRRLSLSARLADHS